MLRELMTNGVKPRAAARVAFRRRYAFLGIFATLVWFSLRFADGRQLVAAEPEYDGAKSCIQCHATDPDGTNWTENKAWVPIAVTDEWRVKDKHATAYDALDGDLGRRMCKLLAIDVNDLLAPD